VETLAPAPAPGRRRLRIILAVVLGVIVLGGVALAAALGGVFDDKGKFTSEPPACDSLEPSLPQLGAPYQPAQDDKNNCDLSGTNKITISYVVVRPPHGDAPAAASNKLKELSPLGLKALPGVGDEAYRWQDRTYFRVSNLLVSVTVSPQPAGPDPRVQAFITDVAQRLAA